MDLCLIFRRERLGIFCFLLLLENKSLESIVLIAVCNNVGDAAFLGPNQKIENPLPQASYIGQFWS
jgi:hypothetical protein